MTWSTFSTVLLFLISLLFKTNYWQSPKLHLKKYPDWDDYTIKELIIEGWDLALQHFIKEKCRSMPKM